MLMAVYLNCNWKNILTKKTSINTPSCAPIKQAKGVPREIMSIAAAKSSNIYFVFSVERLPSFGLPISAGLALLVGLAV